VQLHAYQPPGVVRATKTAVPDATVVKVLHLRDGACVERRFVGAYQRAGTDLFLLDRVTDDGRVGSTGQRLDPAEVTDLAGELAVPFLLAGGLDAHAADDYHAVTVLPGYAGIDVDGAARTRRGAFDPTAVGAIVRSWGTGARHPLSPRQPLHPEEP
jgi:phosphoribosylanthranilate isomerase